MAQLLGYSLRQYQRLEDPADQSLPRWSELERITRELGIDSLFTEDEVEEEQPETVDLRELRDHLDAQHDEVVRRLERIEELARSDAATRGHVG